QAEVLGMDLVFSHLAVLELADHRRGVARSLVHPVLAVYDQHVLAAEPLQHAHLDADQIRMEHAEQLIRRTGRIGQRPQDIEYRPDAQFLAHRRGVLHRAVVVGRKHETDAGLADAGGNLRGAKHDVGAERLQHVGAARSRRHRPAAVLGHARSRGGGDEHRGGGYLKSKRDIAAGADDVDQMLVVGELDLGREFAHDLRRRGDLAYRFLFDAQAHRQRGDHHRRRLAAHDLAHQRKHLVVKYLAVLYRALQRLLQVDGHRGSVWFPLMRSEKIGQKRMTMFGQYGLRMKLDALDRKLAMAHAHDLAVLAGGGHLEARRHRLALDDQRMIAGSGQRVGEAGKDAAAAVRDRRDFAMHDALRAYDPAAERLPDRLVAQADPEYGYSAGEALDQRHRDPGLIRRARPGRNDDLLRLPCRYLLERDRVVAVDVHVRAELAEILDQVVGEAVVVVDHQQHGLVPYAVNSDNRTPRCRGRSAARTARGIRRRNSFGTPGARRRWSAEG